MNYNLKKLLKDQTIPELTNLIVDELASYGVCQYVPYMDGNYHLNLTTESELTSEQLEEVKQVVLNYNKVANDTKEYNKNIVDQRRARYINEVDPYKLEALDDNLTVQEKQDLKDKAKANKAKIKLDLPKRS